MVRYGKPPYLECSSRGDTRFSAFYARIKSLDNKSIEELYQAFKVFIDENGNIRSGLHWRLAKGKTPHNLDECKAYYSKLWDIYIEENPELLAVLKAQSGLSDIFGQVGHCCQAEELWRIRCES